MEPYQIRLGFLAGLCRPATGKLELVSFPFLLLSCPSVITSELVKAARAWVELF